MRQKHFFSLSKQLLGMKGYELADTLGVSRRTFDKWMANPASPDYRRAPIMALRFVLTLLGETKRQALQNGERGTAELIDALAAQVDDRALTQSLHSFDVLQKSAGDFFALERLADKPPFFAHIEDKNRWDEAEVITHARQQQKATAHPA